MVSTTWILTSAFLIQYSNLTVRVGSSSWLEGGQIIIVTRSVAHPGYSAEGSEHNLALLELESPVTHTNAKPATLAHAGIHLSENTLIIVTGWGRTNALNIAYPTALQVMQIPVVDHEVCRKQYANADANYKVTNNMFCAGEYGKSTCSGNEGGAATVGKTVVGITNGWTVGCGFSPASAIFMKVGEYREWIKSVTVV